MLHLYQAKSFLPANPLSDMYVCFFRELFKTVSVTDEDISRVLSKLKFIKFTNEPKEDTLFIYHYTSIKMVYKCGDMLRHGPVLGS